ncbi:MAG: protein kinase [Polyangiaceae bacterium]
MDPGTVVGGRFTIERRVASGGMGAVYRARDLLDGTSVALKVLHSSDHLDAERFEREARIIAALDHPGIVRHVAHGVVPTGERYLAMEWLRGEDLAVRLSRKALLPSEVIAVLRGAASAMAYAHARGIIHRDIKPSNLFLVGGDVTKLKILDFGIARPNRETSRLTATGGVLGTPGYMSPEQLQGHGGLPSVDVFSLGCVAFESITGQPAFEGAHLMAALAKVLFQDPPKVRQARADVPEELSALIARMLSKKPDERPSDGAAVVRELDRIEEILAAWAAAAPDATLSSAPTTLSVPPPSVRPDDRVLTMREQRLVSLVLAGDADAGTGPHAESEPIDLSADTELASIVAACGATLVELGPGSLVAVVSGPGSAVDRAERAAQCALALRTRYPKLPVCVSTGRGISSARFIEGTVIDRGVRTLRSTEQGAVQIDDVTARMLGPRFAIARRPDGVYLAGEASFEHDAPMLLGKPSPWVGRSREMRTLEGVFEGCVQESLASAVLVVGPPGSGKSRLCRELLGRLTTAAREGDRAVTVLTGRASSVAAGSPYGMIADAIRRAAGIRDGEPLDVRRRKLTARLGRSVGGAELGVVSGFLGELCGTPFSDSQARGLRAARDDAMLMNDTTRAAWEDWIAAECALAPVVLVLEDLHWGDAATVRLVSSTLRNLRDAPFLVIGLARREVHDHFPNLWADRDVQVVSLGPLPAKASEQLVRGVLGDRVTSTVLSRIVERADGNPFYLEEIIRAVAAGKEDELPDSVLGTVEARLDAEGAEAKRVLRAASVFGERFSSLGVAALLGGDALQAEIDDTLSALTAHELVAPFNLSGGIAPEYMFRHAIVREAGYAMLTEHDRELGHRLAADFLERAGHADAMAIAEHFRRGGAPDRAVVWYRRAAEHALEANDLRAALERAARASESGATGDELGAIRLIEAEAHVWSGALADGERCASEAIALLPPRSPAWFRAITQAAVANGRRGLTDRVAELVEVARPPAATDEAWRAQMVCLSRAGSYLVFGGRYALADELIDQLNTATASRSDLDPKISAMLHQLHAFRASAASDPGACLTHLQAASAAFERTGDLRNACTMGSNIGCMLTELGDFDGSEATLRSALASAGRLGLRDIEPQILHNLGHALLFKGSLDEARALEQRAALAFHSQGGTRLEGVTRTYAAKIALASGDLGLAEQEARSAKELLAAAPPLRAAAVAILSRVLLAAERAPEALEAAREAYAELEKLGSLEEGDATVRLAYAEALRASGDEARAKDVLVEAKSQLLARAAKISDASWRRSFLTQVPDNALTLMMAPQESVSS